MVIKIEDIYGLHKGFDLTLKPGFTALVGPNGAGKMTLLSQIKTYADQNNIHVWQYSNRREGRHMAEAAAMENRLDFVAASLTASEGEQVAMHFGYTIKDLRGFVLTASSPIFILLDAIDSGASIDRARELRKFFDLIIDTEADREVYIIMAVNHFELARNTDCVHVRTGEHMTFPDYETYASFIEYAVKHPPLGMEI